MRISDWFTFSIFRPTPFSASWLQMVLSHMYCSSMSMERCNGQLVMHLEEQLALVEHQLKLDSMLAMESIITLFQGPGHPMWSVLPIQLILQYPDYGSLKSTAIAWLFPHLHVCVNKQNHASLMAACLSKYSDHIMQEKINNFLTVVMEYWEIFFNNNNYFVLHVCVNAQHAVVGGSVMYLITSACR